MLNLSSIMVGSENPKALADFYEKVLEKKPDMVEEGFYGFLAGNCFISFGQHDKVKGKNQEADRIIFNFESKEVKEEYERIKGLGATVVKELYSMGETNEYWICTFADPDGNLFQVVTPWDEGKN